MFEIGGKEYELKFNLKRVKLIEQRLGEGGVPKALIGSEGMLSIGDCEAFFAFGLKEAGSDVFVNPTRGAELFEQYCEETSYTSAIMRIYEQAQLDLGFMFRAN